MQLGQRRNAFFRTWIDTKEFLVDLSSLIPIAFDLIQTAYHQQWIPLGRIDTNNLFELVNGTVDRVRTRRILRICTADDLKVNGREQFVRFDVVAIDADSFGCHVRSFAQAIIA